MLIFIDIYFDVNLTYEIILCMYIYKRKKYFYMISAEKLLISTGMDTCRN